MVQNGSVNLIDDDRPLDAFELAVKAAVRQFCDPTKLGQSSHLAMPYVLGGAGRGGASNITSLHGRGEALRERLRIAAYDIADSDLQAILSAAVFERPVTAVRRHPGQFRWKTTDQAVAKSLFLHIRTYYRRMDDAIRALAVALNRRMLPPLRSETPEVAKMAGRSRGQLAEKCLERLRAAKSVTVWGIPGSGKTTLGAHIAGQWAWNKVHWFTIRLGFNDRADSFVFSLANTLRLLGQNSSDTWRQLLADEGRVVLDRVLPLLRHDLAARKDAPLLIVIDEVDLLDVAFEHHRELLNVIDDLLGVGPILLIAQRPVLQTAQTLEVLPMAITDLAAWLREAGYELDSNSIAVLLERTQGVPGLVQLYMSLQASGGDMSTTLREGYTPGPEHQKCLIPWLFRILACRPGNFSRSMSSLSANQRQFGAKKRGKTRI